MARLCLSVKIDIFYKVSFKNCSSCGFYTQPVITCPVWTSIVVDTGILSKACPNRNIWLAVWEGKVGKIRLKE